MKFLHTADWQIGMKAVFAGKAGPRVREARLEAARQIVEEANRRGVEFLVLAGDTFEDNGVDRALVQKVADLLARFNGPAFVIPGNHDPLVPGSVWEHAAWKENGRVRVLTEPKPLEVPGGTLYPCPVVARHSAKDPTAWIQARDDKGIRVGLAHGTVEGIRQDEPDYPVPRDAPDRAGLDYLALGHWHSTAVYPDASGAVRLAYSGTPEPTGFGERASGRVLMVEIDGHGAPPSATEIRTSRLHWVSLAEELSGDGDLVRVRKRIEALEAPHETLLALRLSGLLSAGERAELERLQEVVGSRFLFGNLDLVRLRPAPGDERWVEELPDGFLREAAGRLRDWSHPLFAGPRPEGASPEVAARALLELCALAQKEAPA
ncbi:MAG: DNA repair exonuclease [bacterium]